MDWQRKRLEIVGAMNYYKGQLDICDEAIKDQQTCEANSGMDQSPSERVQITPSTESPASHGSNAISVPSVSPAQRASNTTNSGS